MMHEIGFQVVAEGVETEEQYHILDYMDCDYIQGYYFAKPMNEKEFVAFLKSHNCRYQDAEVPKEAWTKHRKEDGQSEKPEEGNRTDKRRNMIIRGTMKRTKRSLRRSITRSPS